MDDREGEPVNKSAKALKQKLDTLGISVQNEMEQAVKRTMLQARALAVAKAPSGGGSQAMGSGEVSVRGGITAELKGRIGRRVTGQVLSNSPHGTYVELGTGPLGARSHAGISPDIRPTYSMAFYIKNRASPRFGHELRRPDGTPYWIFNRDGVFYKSSGQPARPYMYPASKETRPIFRDEAARALRDALAKWGGK